MRSKSGIAPAIIAVVVVVIIVVAGVGAYVALSGKSSSSSVLTTSSVPLATSSSSSSASAPPSSSSSSSSSSGSSSSQSSPSASNITVSTSSSSMPVSSTSITTNSSSSITSQTTSQFSDTCATNTSSLSLLSVIPLLTSYSSMQISLNGTTNGKPLSLTESYNIVSKTSSAFNVSLMYSGNTSLTMGVLVGSNGSVLALIENGTVIPAQYGGAAAVGLFAGFIFEIEYSNSLYNLTSAVQFHATGTSTVTIGSVQIPVTTWAANSLPVAVTECGSSDTLSAFSLAEGTPAGATIPVVTYFNFAGSSTSGGQNSTVALTFRVTGLTVG